MSAPSFQARRVDTGTTIPYTPDVDAPAGTVVVVGTTIGVVPMSIAANELGELEMRGIWKFKKDSSGFSFGDSVYWDADGNPVSGATGSGAATNTASQNNLAGICVGDAAGGDETVDVYLMGVAAALVSE